MLEKLVYFHTFDLILSGPNIIFRKYILENICFVICLILLHAIYIITVMYYAFDEKRNYILYYHVYRMYGHTHTQTHTHARALCLCVSYDLNKWQIRCIGYFKLKNYRLCVFSAKCFSLFLGFRKCKLIGSIPHL